MLKARWVKDKYGYDCFADDTGLEVDALGGEPGVHSARYAEGTDHDSEANMRKLLAKLGNNNNRKARFRTIITLIRRQDAPSASPCTDCFCGEVEGKLALEKHGTEGFGYDPVFAPDEAGGLAFAQMDMKAKNAISHRGRAIAQLARFLSEQA